MTSSLADILCGIPHDLKGSGHVPVSGIAYDSRRVRKGNAFFCVCGLESDGHDFAQAAVDRGASAIVCERWLDFPGADGIPQAKVPDARSALALAAANFYGSPSEKLALIGVTGTNGKTTTTYLIEHMLNACGITCGVIGTCGARVDGYELESAHTTPESADLERLLAQMLELGAQASALEVSSHALEMGRVRNVHFAITAFTNLTQDHLDFHKDMESYYQAKKHLFSDEFPATRVISTFGDAGRRLARECEEAGDRVVRVGPHPSDDLRLIERKQVGADAELELRALDGSALRLTHPLVGMFNTENVMVALASALVAGADLGQAAASLADASSPPGRMQRVKVAPEMDFAAFVDYAHTPDAIEKAIEAAREVSQGNVHIVFGCEGDRDKGKRALMLEAALGADHVHLTNDNAHSERVMDILSEVMACMPKGAADALGSKVKMIPDRKRAIKQAVYSASPGDVILVCGRGHETVMEFGRDRVHFDDAEEIRYHMLMLAVDEGREVREAR
ncbi:MAG: UDP-N-acetylmuramoyl-L-alanyl-D-glutamate--2,6-diaminopimelate ligase [Eggerthellaceae bacterium]|nr:UDP-N-acetylmuramoyl-L-alanyl-D-glutamate--2,6-diaminopimelate ligase [Eggerthellaceae bacterium]